MIFKAYSVRDSKSEFYLSPSFHLDEVEAVRYFTVQSRNPSNLINQFPEDYDLYYLGEYDNTSGKMNLLDSPEHVIKAVNVKTQIQPKS